MNQPHPPPPNYDEPIEADYLVRVVNRVIDQLDLSMVLVSYYPLRLLKVLVYAAAKGAAKGRTAASKPSHLRHQASYILS